MGLDNDPHQSHGLGEETDGATTEPAEATDGFEDTDGSGSSTTGIDDSSATASTTSDDGTTTDGDGTEGGVDCSDLWRTERSDGRLRDLVLDETAGVLHLIGNRESGEPWAMTLDACDGSVLADVDVVHDGGTNARLDSLLLHDGSLFAAGSVPLADDPRNGLLVRLDPTDLGAVYTTPLYGSPNLDELLDITVSTSGRLWMVGTTQYDMNPGAWTVSAQTDGTACGFNWMGSGSGTNRAVGADGDQIVVATRTTDGQLVLLRYAQDCACTCLPTWESDPIEIGAAETNIGDLVVIGGQYYVAGWANDSALPDQIFGYAAWVSSTGALIEDYRANPSGQGDGFFAAGTDGERLFLSGAQGWSGAAGLAGTSALLQALPVSFGPGVAAEWEASPMGVGYIDGMGIDSAADGSIYLGGNVDGGDGIVVRCDKLGICG
ncbi:MAG: hypothetical protein AAF799_44605 [Myxococcota bacterium]